MDNKKNDKLASPYMDVTLSIDDRVKDLLGRMTLEEKVRQMDIYSGGEIASFKRDIDLNKVEVTIDYDKLKGISKTVGIGCIQIRDSNVHINNEIQKYLIENTRLGIPALFSEEALHGLLHYDCTVFPQQITLASTWNPELAKKQGRAIATETRSLGIHETWSPVLDLARDIRWGRVEEGYGEDTYLASRFAASMVRGLQGEDLKNSDCIISEPKHFTGYGAPRGGLNCAPAMMGKHEHAFYCLPVFEAAFCEGGALNTMCSYNSIDSIPVSCDKSLLTGVLRDKWVMQGFVRSDMTAVAMLYTCHFVAKTKEEAIRMGIEAGVDMQLYDFPHDFYQSSIIKMVNDDELDEKLVDLAAGRILKVKFMLGLFENPYTDPTISKKVVHCQKHKDIALEVARQGICLLKNSEKILPLDKNISSIAVIGPSATVARLGDYSVIGGSQHAVPLLDGIKKVVSPHTKIYYAKGCEILESDVMPIPTNWLRDNDGNKGLKGEYYNSNELEGNPVLIRTDSNINFNWIYTKPGDGVNADRFSVRWTGKLIPTKSFQGLLGLSSNDSMRLWVDDILIVDNWDKSNKDSQMVSFNFISGKEYDIKIEFTNDARGARVIFGYSYGNADIEEAVNAAKKAEVAIVAVGDSDETCGENLDRADLNLPGRQLELVKRIYETGTPIILVLQNGRPLSITWETEHLPAIIEAWYPGERGGQAIAEVLFGDVNPGGRIPLSFPKSIGQLPVNYNRRPFGAVKYVEMDWNPLFPFGYGLSYTTFEYSNLTFSSKKIKIGEKVKVSFDITNIGDVGGDEVAQLYIHDKVSSVIRPYIELKGFKRIYLEPQETKNVTLELGFDEFKLLTRDFKWVVEPGEFIIMIGSNSANIILKDTVEVLD